MEKLLFTDGDKIGVFDGEKVRYIESEFIARYRNYAQTRTKNDEWKYGGDGARFRGDYDRYRARANETVTAYINGVQWDGDKILYSFTVNGTSGVYRTTATDEKGREEHILTSSDEEFLSIHASGRMLAVTVRVGEFSSVGTLDCVNSELKTLTGGDSRDANATFSSVNGNLLYFDSAGAGMDAAGNFTGKFSPSVICSLNLDTMEIKEILSDEKKSFVKPKEAKDGTMYCIERPTKEKRGGNVFLDILLIPYRILQAIVMFIQTFVVLFTGKSLTSATDGGDNPTKGRNTDPKKLYVDGNRIEAEKELKRNKRFKDKEYGFIPMSWKLVKVVDGKTEPIKSGICDFALCEDGGLYCTNGKRIFYISDGKCKKIADTDTCLCVATASTASARTDFFL